MKRGVQNALLLVHFAVFMMLVGGATMETFISFPNWFAEIPESLMRVKGYLVARNPGQYFQSVAPATILTGLLFVIVGWRRGAERNRVLIGVLLLIGLELVTFNMVYPKLRILLGRGDQANVVHSAAQLKETAAQFLTINGWRLIVMYLAAFCSGLAVFRAMRERRPDELDVSEN